MGVMDKFLNYMKLNEDDDDFYDDDYYEERPVEEKPKSFRQHGKISLWRKINLSRRPRLRSRL